MMRSARHKNRFSLLTTKRPLKHAVAIFRVDGHALSKV
jgi:hypothetical protein